MDDVVQDNEGDMQHADDEKMDEKKKKKPRKAQNKKQEELPPPAGKWTLCRRKMPSKCNGCNARCPAWDMKLLYEPHVANDGKNWNGRVFYRYFYITCTCWSRNFPVPDLAILVMDVPDKPSSSREQGETAEAKEAEINGALNRLREELGKL